MRHRRRSARMLISTSVRSWTVYLGSHILPQGQHTGYLQHHATPHHVRPKQYLLPAQLQLPHTGALQSAISTVRPQLRGVRHVEGHSPTKDCKIQRNTAEQVHKPFNARTPTSCTKSSQAKPHPPLPPIIPQNQKMCNTLAYAYTCTHILSHRRSACHGTKHKQGRSGVKAACLPEPCLTVRLSRVCGACELLAWEEGWRARLERARAFVEAVGGGERGRRLKDASTDPARISPSLSTPKASATALKALTTLLSSLHTTHRTHSWHQHTSLPRRPKSQIPRVPPTVFTRTSSPLRHSVLPDDIVAPTQQRPWSEVRIEEYDWEYVASTDPLHPVSAVYEYPGEGVDGAWGVWALDGEEEEEGNGEGSGGEAGSEVGFEDPGSAWEWEHGNSEQGGESGMETVHVRLRGGNGCEHECEGTRQDGGEDGLEGWNEDGLGKMSAAQCSDAELRDSQDMDADVENIVKSFWAAVNDGLEPEIYGLERLR